MKLCDANKKQIVQVLSIDLQSPIKERIQSLGLIQNTEIKVMQKKKNGTMIIDIRGTRFALGDLITRKIEVKLCQKK